eukprot:717742-Rhodomonas_salina.1
MSQLCGQCSRLSVVMHDEQGQRLGLAATSAKKKGSKTKGENPSKNSDNANAGNMKSASVSPK